jgi:hypothetical protein
MGASRQTAWTANNPCVWKRKGCLAGESPFPGALPILQPHSLFFGNDTVVVVKVDRTKTLPGPVTPGGKGMTSPARFDILQTTGTDVPVLEAGESHQLPAYGAARLSRVVNLIVSAFLVLNIHVLYLFLIKY